MAWGRRRRFHRARPAIGGGGRPGALRWRNLHIIWKPRSGFCRPMLQPPEASDRPVQSKCHRPLRQVKRSIHFAELGRGRCDCQAGSGAVSASEMPVDMRRTSAFATNKIESGWNRSRSGIFPGAASLRCRPCSYPPPRDTTRNSRRRVRGEASAGNSSGNRGARSRAPLPTVSASSTSASGMSRRPR